jgi:hypothetical protein
VRRLREGRRAWNAWRREQPNVVPRLAGERLDRAELRGFDLSGADLRGAWLREARLDGADLSHAYLHSAHLEGAWLDGAEIWSANLSQVDLTGAHLRRASLRATTLRRAVLIGADFSGANLSHVSMPLARIEGAIFRGAQIYGLAAWSLEGKPNDQAGMFVYSPREVDVDLRARPRPITVDDLETAQFLHLLVDNPSIARILADVNERTVLLLGRFTSQRKRVLDHLKRLLLKADFVPLLFDFPPSESRDLTETVACLAHLSCFVIADLTAARSIPQELSVIAPHLPSVPIVPILQADQEPYALFKHIARSPWVRPIVRYRDVDHLSRIFRRQVLEPGYQAARQARRQSVSSMRPPAPSRTPWPAVIRIDWRRSPPGYRPGPASQALEDRQKAPRRQRHGEAEK